MATNTVLIVEDNELNMKLFRDLLQTHGLSIIETKNGFDAVSLAKTHLPNLILMDIQLPGISGIDVIRSIKADPQLANIPIIAITAFAMKEDRDRIMESGCEGYLPKPISISLFLDMVSKYLNIDLKKKGNNNE
ncbi:MAG: response regulator [Alphaproteobacteria bacterium]|nr:response regulator [Alphaproteobacteria bacterium]